MSTTKTAGPVAVTQLERLIVAEIKGGTKKREFILSLVMYAIREVLKGNANDIKTAQNFCAGKAKKARAFAAGFVAIGDIGRACYEDGTPYAGRWDAATNKDLRANVETLAQAKTAAFAGAYDTIMAEKPVTKAKTEPKVETASAGTGGDETTGAATGAATSTDKAHNDAVALDASVELVARMVATGALTGAQLDSLRESLAALEESEIRAAAAVRDAARIAAAAELAAATAAAAAAPAKAKRAPSAKALAKDAARLAKNEADSAAFVSSMAHAFARSADQMAPVTL